jgi:hypothetical protein
VNEAEAWINGGARGGAEAAGGGIAMERRVLAVQRDRMASDRRALGGGMLFARTP